MAPKAGRAPRVSESIAKRIQRQITSGRLRAGSRLPPERDMAERYKTSRVSVREAYRSLEELGLLDVRRGADGGAFIARMDHGAVQRSLSMALRLGEMSDAELTDARLILEPGIARLAARHATGEDLAKLQQVLDRQQALRAKKGHHGPTILLFHRTLAACAHNLPLATLLNALADLSVESGASKPTAPLSEDVSRSHQLIFEAVARHDEAAAHDLMARHLRKKD